MRAQAKKDAQNDNRQIWKRQIAEREQKQREWKFQDMHAPVGSPLNFIQMKNGGSRSGVRDEFHPNIDSKGATHLYPFPIEDAARTADQQEHRDINQSDARNALLDQIKYNDMKRHINKEQELRFGNQMNRNAQDSLMGENMFHSLKRKKAMELMRSHWEANIKNKEHAKKTSAIFE